MRRDRYGSVGGVASTTVSRPLGAAGGPRVTATLAAASLMVVGLVASVPAESAATQQEAQQPIVRARLDPADSITVGQPVTVEVEVLVPSFFTGAPRFSDLDVPGALVIFNDRGRNLTERLDGATWTGQSRSYTVYPQRAGDYDVSGIEVEVPYSTGGAGGTTGTVAPDPLSFEATVPPGAEGLGYFIATSALDISQDVATVHAAPGDPGAAADTSGADNDADAPADTSGADNDADAPADTGGADNDADAPATQAAADPPAAGTPDDGARTLRVGESLTRTVTVTVQDALAMVIPPLDLGASDGLAAYPAPPRVEDSSTERGALPVGTRRESTTYVAESEGTHRLPAVELTWWDPSAGRLRRSTAPAVDVEVIANPDLAVDFDPADAAAASIDTTAPAPRLDLAAYARRYGPFLLAAILVVVASLRLARRFGYRIPHPWRRDPATRLEAHRFAEFRRAARSGRAPDTARAFMRWLDAWYRRPGTYAEFSDAAADPEMDRQGRALADALYAAPDRRAGAWSGPDLARHVRRARRTARNVASTATDPPLPPLNP